MPSGRPHAVEDPNGGPPILEEYCIGQFPHGCKATTKDYQHQLNVVLVNGLSKLYRYHLAHGWSPVNVRHDLDMTFSEWENFQKLRYFGLVEKSYDEDGKRIRANWKITDKGVRFVRNKGWCYPKVWTWRGDPIEFEGDPISIKEAFKEIWEAEDYAAGARPHDVTDIMLEDDAPDEEDDDGQPQDRA